MDPKASGSSLASLSQALPPAQLVSFPRFFWSGSTSSTIFLLLLHCLSLHYTFKLLILIFSPNFYFPLKPLYFLFLWTCQNLSLKINLFWECDLAAATSFLILPGLNSSHNQRFSPEVTIDSINISPEKFNTVINFINLVSLTYIR